MARTVPQGTTAGTTDFGGLNYITVTVRAGAAIDSAKISQNQGIFQGQMVGFKVKANQPSNDCTFTLGIKDRDGDTIYTSGNLEDDATTVVMGLNVPIVEQEKITITPSTNVGATALVVQVTIYFNPDNDIAAARWGGR